MLDNAESAAIVSAIAGLGASLDVPITAEGIENSTVIERLTALGCSKGQGWHFGQPLSIDQTRVMLADKFLLPNRRGSKQYAVDNKPVEDVSLRRAAR